jgi:hypothetical protein
MWKHGWERGSTEEWGMGWGAGKDQHGMDVLCQDPGQVGNMSQAWQVDVLQWFTILPGRAGTTHVQWSTDSRQTNGKNQQGDTRAKLIN